MTTSQSAINGLQRCLSFTEEQRDSDSSFYSSGIESLKQIRDLAVQVMLASNEALAKVGLDEPLEIVPVKSQNSELATTILEEAAKVSEETASKVINQMFSIVFNQFQGNSQQNIVVNSIESCKIDVQPENFIKNIVDEEDFEEEPLEIVEIEESHNYIHDFKEILHDVAILPASKFSSPQVKSISSLISEYFDVRFCKKYDPNQIHWFSKKKMRDYLLSVLIRCVESESCENFQNLYDDLKKWLADIKVSPSKYTLPPEYNSIFFNILLKSPDSVDRPLSKSAFDRLIKVWDELWGLGYYKFNNLSYASYHPTKNLDWVRENLISATNLDSSDVKHFNLDRAVKLLLSRWTSLEKYESFDLCKAISIRSNKNLRKFSYQDMVKLPHSLLEDSLKVYVKANGYSSIDNLKSKLESMESIMNFADNNFATIQERYEYLNQYPPDQLDLVEVFETYINQAVSDDCVED